MSPRRITRLHKHQRARKRWRNTIRRWNAIAESGEEVRLGTYSGFDVIYYDGTRLQRNLTS